MWSIIAFESDDDIQQRIGSPRRELVVVSTTFFEWFHNGASLAEKRDWERDGGLVCEVYHLHNYESYTSIVEGQVEGLYVMMSVKEKKDNGDNNRLERHDRTYREEYRGWFLEKMHKVPHSLRYIRKQMRYDGGVSNRMDPKNVYPFLSLVRELSQCSHQRLLKIKFI